MTEHDGHSQDCVSTVTLRPPSIELSSIGSRSSFSSQVPLTDRPLSPVSLCSDRAEDTWQEPAPAADTQAGSSALSLDPNAQSAQAPCSSADVNSSIQPSLIGTDYTQRAPGDSRVDLERGTSSRTSRARPSMCCIASGVGLAAVGAAMAGSVIWYFVASSKHPAPTGDGVSHANHSVEDRSLGTTSGIGTRASIDWGAGTGPTPSITLGGTDDETNVGGRGVIERNWQGIRI